MVNDGSLAQGSRIVIGGYDLEKYAMPNQTIKWLPLKPYTQFWGLNFNDRIGIKKNGKIEKVIESTSTTAILDTGSSYILIPSADFYQYVTHVYKKI